MLAKGTKVGSRPLTAGYSSFSRKTSKTAGFGQALSPVGTMSMPGSESHGASSPTSMHQYNNLLKYIDKHRKMIGRNQNHMKTTTSALNKFKKAKQMESPLQTL